MKVIIPSIEENFVNDTRNTNIVTEYKENVISGSNSKVENFLININTASQEKLESLLGIGFAIAFKVISYREKNGFFSSGEDIKNVSGIGDSKFNNIKDLICVK